MKLLCLLCCLSVAFAGSTNEIKETHKDQFCTDPRTMRKHNAYTEWADAYSCSRHRCQPGGRTLAIYTVGCKRVEAPESAIECEEVVEDTNMQFPFCCTRLRCLVVVRGEVWTRVLGQPWETLPAAPWSHMYKMKKPPPADTTFLPKTEDQGPIYELAEPEAEGTREKVLRSGKKSLPTDSTDGNEVVPRAAPPPPDIVIALSTNSDQQKDHKKDGSSRHKRMRKTPNNLLFEEDHRKPETNDMEEPAISVSTEKPAELSEEHFYANAYGVTQKVPFKSQFHQVAWTEIPQNQWNEHDPAMEQDRDAGYQQTEPPSVDGEKKEERPANLQALVDAIGTRMRDIENVVQRMSEKVHHAKPVEYVSREKRNPTEPDETQHKYHKSDKAEKGYEETKRPSPEGEHYKRFSVRNRGSKYLHGSNDATTDQPLFIEDTKLNGYFSDASNSVVRRANAPKEPAAPTYMAPVDTRRKASEHSAVASDVSEDEKKHKKHSHKKRKNKNGRSHKKHRGKEDKKKHFSRMSSVEIDKNVVSLEDSSALASK